MIKINARASRTAVLALVLLGVAGCSDMDEMQQRMLSGGAIGIATGAAATVVTGGCIACGMAVGGAVGTASGYIVDKLDNSTRSNSPPAPAPQSYNSSVPQGYPAGGSYGSGQ